MNHPIVWNRTSQQMVEETLRAAHARLAGRYRNRLTDLRRASVGGEQPAPNNPTTIPELAQAFSRTLKPMLRTLNPVTNEQTFRFAQHAIDRSLVAIEILVEDDVEQLKAMTLLSGQDICRLMRQHDVSIRELATRMNITLKRVREVREKGVKTNAYCRDWYEAITASGIFSAS